MPKDQAGNHPKSQFPIRTPARSAGESTQVWTPRQSIPRDRRGNRPRSGFPDNRSRKIAGESTQEAIPHQRLAKGRQKNRRQSRVPDVPGSTEWREDSPYRRLRRAESASPRRRCTRRRIPQRGSPRDPVPPGGTSRKTGKRAAPSTAALRASARDDRWRDPLLAAPRLTTPGSAPGTDRCACAALRRARRSSTGCAGA